MEPPAGLSMFSISTYLPYILPILGVSALSPPSSTTTLAHPADQTVQPVCWLHLICISLSPSCTKQRSQPTLHTYYLPAYLLTTPYWFRSPLQSVDSIHTYIHTYLHTDRPHPTTRLLRVRGRFSKSPTLQHAQTTSRSIATIDSRPAASRVPRSLGLEIPTTSRQGPLDKPLPHPYHRSLARELAGC